MEQEDFEELEDDSLLEEEFKPSSDIIEDKDVLEIDECVSIISQIISLMNKLEDYKSKISDKRREIDYKISDILHPLEDEIFEENNLTSKGCRNILKNLSHLRKMRRILKVEDELLYEFEKRYSKLNNATNRKFILSDICKIKSKLIRPYKYRITTQEEINKMFDRKINVKEMEEINSE